MSIKLNPKVWYWLNASPKTQDSLRLHDLAHHNLFICSIATSTASCTGTSSLRTSCMPTHLRTPLWRLSTSVSLCASNQVASSYFLHACLKKLPKSKAIFSLLRDSSLVFQVTGSVRSLDPPTTWHLKSWSGTTGKKSTSGVQESYSTSCYVVSHLSGLVSCMHRCLSETPNSVLVQQLDHWLSARWSFAETDEGIAQAIIRSNLDFSREPWPKVSENAKDLVRKMLDPSAYSRLTAQQVLG